MRGRLKRQRRLAAIFTTLFVLQAPLCSAACLRSADLAGEIRAVAVTPDPPQAVPACHEQRTTSDPAPPTTHEDCSCHVGVDVLVSQPSDLPTPNLSACLPASIQPDPHDVRAVREPSIVAGLDLPPPDILLLKSTLII